MKKSKVISVGYNRFVVPADMSTKDLQSLLGFLATLQTADTTMNFDDGSYMAYITGCPSIKLEEVELMAAEEARKIHDESHARYMARKETEKSS